MTILRPFSKFMASACLTAGALITLGCSDDKPANDASAGSAGSGASGGSGTAGGSGNAAGSSSSGGSSNTVTGPATVIGAFEASIKTLEQKTEVIGGVKDGPLPPNVIWTDTSTDGDCVLQEPSVPFCDPGCGGEICTEGNVCKPYPVGHSVGEVTVTGVELATGEKQLILKEINASYQAPAGTKYAFPPFAAGDEIALHAAGGDYPGFDLAAPGVAPIELSSSDFELDVDKAFALTWDAASDSKASTVHLKLDISHHGGARGRIVCDTADDGELTLSAESITALIGLGVSGFPTVELTRISHDVAQTELGRVELNVTSFFSQSVTVVGVTSCNADTCEGDAAPDCLACPDGMMCRSDLVCE